MLSHEEQRRRDRDAVEEAIRRMREEEFWKGQNSWDPSPLNDMLNRAGITGFNVGELASAFGLMGDRESLAKLSAVCSEVARTTAGLSPPSKDVIEVARRTLEDLQRKAYEQREVLKKLVVEVVITLLAHSGIPCPPLSSSMKGTALVGAARAL